MVSKAYTSATAYTKAQDYTPALDLAVVTPIDTTFTLIGLDGTEYDVTDYTVRSSGSRSRSNALSAAQPGTADVTLRNEDRRFDPGYSSSPYYGNIGLGCQLKIECTPSGGSAQQLYLGEVQSWDLDWIGPMGNDDYRTDTTNVRLSCVDKLSKLGNVRTLDSLVWLDIGYGAATRYGGYGSTIVGYVPNVASNTNIESVLIQQDRGLPTDAAGQRVSAAGEPLWDAQTGTWTAIASTPDYVAATATNYSAATMVIGTANNYAVESEIRWNKGAGTTNWPGMIVAGLSTSAYLLVMGNGSSGLQVAAYISGGITSLSGNFAGFTLTSGATHRVRAIVRDRKVVVAYENSGVWTYIGSYTIPATYWDALASAESNYVGWFAHNTTSARFYDFYVHDAGQPIVPRQRSLERAQTLLGLINPDTGTAVVSPDNITVSPSGARGYATCPPEVLSGNLLTVLQALERTEYSRGFYCDRTGNIKLLARYPATAASNQFTVDWDSTSSGTVTYTSLSIGLDWQRYRNAVSGQRYDPYGVLTDIPSPSATDEAGVAAYGQRDLGWGDLRIDTSTDGDWVVKSLVDGVLADTVTDTSEVLYPKQFTIQAGADSASVATIQAALSADIGDKVTVGYWPTSGSSSVSQAGWVDQISWDIVPKFPPKITFRLSGPYQMRSGSYVEVGFGNTSSWKVAY